MQREDSVNLITLFYNFYRYKWGVLLIITAILTTTFFYTKKTTPIYSSDILINIESGKESSMKSLFLKNNIRNRDMEEILNYNITILKSRHIISKVLNKIDLSQQFFIEEKWRDRELYKKEIPFKLHFYNKWSDNSSFKFTIEELDKDTFALKLTDKSDNNSTKYHYKYGHNIEINNHKLKIDKKNPKLSLVNKKYIIKIENNKNILISTILKNLSIEKKVDRLLKISYEDAIPLRAKDIITQLVSSYEEYNLNAIQLKDVNNISFLNKSILEIEHKLKKIENKIRKYKLKNRELLSLNSEDKIFLNTIEKNRDIANLSLKLNALKITKQRIKNGIYSSTLLQNSNLHTGDINQLMTTLRDKETHLTLLTRQKANSNILLIDEPSFRNIFNQLKKSEKELRELIIEYTEEYPKVKKIQTDIDTLKTEIKNYLTNTTNIYSNDINRLKREINKTIDSLITSTKKEYLNIKNSLNKDKRNIDKLPKSTMKLRELQREFEINENNYKKLLQKRSESLISKELTISNIQIVDSAVEPIKPIKPKKSFLYLSGLILGLLLSIIYTSFRVYRDKSIYSENDIISPKYSLIYNKNGKIDDNIWTLISHLEKSTLLDKSKTILITSSDYDENKSITTEKLALSLNSISKKVLIIDFDTYYPQIIEESSIGLSTLLTSKHSFDEIEITDYINYTDKKYKDIDILPSGPILPNGSSLLFNSKVEFLLESLSKEYDYILIDASPLGKYPETSILLKYIDTLLIVSKIKKTDRRFFEKLNELDKGDMEKVIFLTN